ncbi:unnamed protein product [Blepharisma stoltei]|uniref:Uncharacterized protein n=1 Tax=Blepharisma stoltei TaxID=1481888 RepID=A0AAU9JZN6_9CILI|nr:unnamed protein product [Blepharisma stoltei]
MESLENKKSLKRKKRMSIDELKTEISLSNSFHPSETAETFKAKSDNLSNSFETEPNSAIDVISGHSCNISPDRSPLLDFPKISARIKDHSNPKFSEIVDKIKNPTEFEILWVQWSRNLAWRNIKEFILWINRDYKRSINDKSKGKYARSAKREDRKDRLWYREKTQNIGSYVIENNEASIINPNSTESCWKDLLFDSENTDLKVSLPVLDNYFESDFLIFDILLLGFGISLKGITPRATALKLKLDSLKIALSSNLALQDRHKVLLQLIPLLLINCQFSEAEIKIDSAQQISDSPELDLWRGWLSLIDYEKSKKKPKIIQNFSNLFVEGPMKILSEIGSILNIFYFSWFGYSRSISALKQLRIGKYEELVSAFIMYKTGDSSLENTAVEKFNLCLQVGEDIGMLAFLILYRHYKNYDKYKAIVAMCNLLKSFPLSEDSLSIVTSCYIKTSGKLRQLKEMPPSATNILSYYQYARTSIKYSLNLPIHLVRNCIETVVKYLERFKLNNYLFYALFWKFQLYRVNGIHFTASSIAKYALKYEKKDTAKEGSINKFLKKLQFIKQCIEAIYKGSRDISIVRKIEEFDEYIGKALAILVEKPQSLALHQSLLVSKYRFEGYFINWMRVFKLNKFREKQVKSSGSQDDKDLIDNFHPLYYISQLKQNYSIVKASHSSCLSLKPSSLWNLCGKYYGPIGISDSIDIMEAKTYLRTCISKAIKVLKKGIERPNPSPLLYYFLGKYQLERLKLKDERKQTKLTEISGFLKSFSPIPSTSDLYKVKVLYHQAELYYFYRDLEEAFKYYEAAEKEAAKYNCIEYLNKENHIINKNVFNVK